MRPSHRAYLDSVEDHEQFPAVRCDKALREEGVHVCMYGRTSSSGVESMNRANNEIRQRTAVDILNAALVLIKNESERFDRNKNDAHKVAVWATTPPLTQKRMNLMDEIFRKCDPSMYRIHLTEHETFHSFVVSKLSASFREYILRIPKTAEEEHHGSRFGMCTCGFPSKEGLPCNHMVAIVKSGQIPDLSKFDIMPYWYSRTKWQLQFPVNGTCKSDITLASIKLNHRPDEFIKYCPSWVAGKKKGRPKTEKRKLGIVDHVRKGVSKKRRRNYDRTLPSAIFDSIDDDNAHGLNWDDIQLEENKKYEMDGYQGPV